MRLLRPADALGHRRLGHEEGARDLRRWSARRPRAASARAATARRQRRVAAQEQQGQRVVLVRRRSSRRAPAATPRRRGSARGAGPRAGGAPTSLRNWSVSRRDATVISQPRGLSGTPSPGHWSGGGEQRLLDRVLAGVELAVAPDQRAEDLRRELAQQVLDGAVGRRSVTSPRPDAVHQRPDLDGVVLGDRARRSRSPARCSSHVDRADAGQLLLGLAERAVGDDRERRPASGSSWCRSDRRVRRREAARPTLVSSRSACHGCRCTRSRSAGGIVSQVAGLL